MARLHDLDKVPPTMNEALNGMLAPTRGFDRLSMLEEFQDRFEHVMRAHERQLTSDLRSRGASSVLLHEWDLALAGLQDFMQALKGEIEDAERDR